MSDIFDKDRAISLMKRIFDVIQESGCTHAEAFSAVMWAQASYTGFMGEKYVELARKWRDEGLQERLDALREPAVADDGGSDHADLLST